jgi:hypothetical protein
MPVGARFEHAVMSARTFVGGEDLGWVAVALIGRAAPTHSSGVGVPPAGGPHPVA